MKNKRVAQIVIGLIMISFICGAAYAANISINSSTSANVPGKGLGVSLKFKAVSNQSVLQSAYYAITCRTAFAGAMINKTISTDPKLSYLNTNMSILTNDSLHLQTYVANGSATKFAFYLHTVYDPQLVKLYLIGRSSIISDHNMTLSEKVALGHDFLTGLSNYSKCVSVPLENLSEAKLAFYNDSVIHFSAQISNLSAKGVNTTNMSLILQGAQSQIITPFKLAIQGNTNSTQLWSALNEYCLYDGCPVGLNYHLDAKINIAKLDAITAKLRNVSNDTVDLNAAQASLNNASAELTKVGTAQYSGGAGVQIWTNIDSAVVSLHSAFNKLSK